MLRFLKIVLGLLAEIVFKNLDLLAIYVYSSAKLVAISSDKQFGNRCRLVLEFSHENS